LTKHDYGGQDRLIRITYPDGSRIDYRYDPAGNRTEIQTGPPTSGRYRPIRPMLAQRRAWA